MNTPLRDKARTLVVRNALLLVVLLGILLGCGLVSCVGRAWGAEGFPARIERTAGVVRAEGLRVDPWLITAARRSFGREHYDCGGCPKCLRNQRRRRGSVGPGQFLPSWWKRGRGAFVGMPGHAHYDWRLCADCSVYVMIHNTAAKRGTKAQKAYMRRHWRATCGSLR